MIRSYRGRWPQIAVSAYIDPAAVIIGDVTIGEHASIWPGAVVRGDVHWIRIGARSNIQDGSVLHVMKDQYPLIIEENVTVGHGVILARLHDRIASAGGHGIDSAKQCARGHGIDHCRGYASGGGHQGRVGQSIYGASGEIAAHVDAGGTRGDRRVRRSVCGVRADVPRRRFRFAGGGCEVSGHAAQSAGCVQASGPKGPIGQGTAMLDLKVRPPTFLDYQPSGWKIPRAPAESAGRPGLQSLRKAESSSPAAPRNETNLVLGSSAK